MKLALGTVQFGLHYGIKNNIGRVPERSAKAMLNLAISNGINLLDTAITYGDSEAVLGRLGIQDFLAVTKLPPIPQECSEVEDWVQDQVEKSKNRLDVKKLYGVLLHRSDQLLGTHGSTLYRSLLNLKEDGKTLKIGISIYSPEELDLIIPRFPLDLVQAPFNLVDRRMHESGWLNRLKDKGIEIHARSVFLQGLLLMDHSSLPNKFSPWSELWASWHNWLTSNFASSVQTCLAFPLSFLEIDRVIVGADNLEQLRQIIEASKKRFPDTFPDIQCNDDRLINPSNWSQ